MPLLAALSSLILAANDISDIDYDQAEGAAGCPEYCHNVHVVSQYHCGTAEVRDSMFQSINIETDFNIHFQYWFLSLSLQKPCDKNYMVYNLLTWGFWV